MKCNRVGQGEWNETGGTTDENLFRTDPCGLGALLLGATIASAQLATQNDTMVTFSAPVSLPGVTLPAGSYLFKLADSQVNRNVVQVFAQDRSKIFATILAIPAERTEPADETVITFKEAPANSAPAVQYRYYPGDKRGQEFVYPKSQAVAIANAAHTSVLSVDSDAADMDAMNPPRSHASNRVRTRRQARPRRQPPRRRRRAAHRLRSRGLLRRQPQRLP